MMVEDDDNVMMTDDLIAEKQSTLVGIATDGLKGEF